ncbi:MAG TPA: winged helix-turn-helix domain-containing protein [Streptosporangiaceae bacterium]|nr:winged helix-turn-helix domain-containing protein [Streptosporangiaceae bacterium]
MQVDHDSAVPVWRQIAALVAGVITRPGQRLPSELTLCQELGVSRGTVRHAYRHLASQGWVVIVAGKGIYAADPLPRGTPDV